MKILIIDDEQDFAFFLSRLLKQEKYFVDSASDGEEGLYFSQINHYDAILLDLNLPGIEGLEILKKIRKDNDEVKVMIISANDYLQTRIEGMDLGSNDYLIKPFEFDELLARLRALLRRKFSTLNKEVVIGILTINLDEQKTYISGKEVMLTPKEYGILRLLITNMGHIVTGEEILECVWGDDAIFFSGTVKVHMHSLRKKLSASGLPVNFIQTYRGKGYMIDKDIM